MKMSHVVAAIAALLAFAFFAFYFSLPAAIDDNIQDDVMAVIEVQPEFESAQFEVTESDGVITIRGTVETDAVRERVIETIIKVNGVVRVIDEIKVEPVSDNSDE